MAMNELYAQANPQAMDMIQKGLQAMIAVPYIFSHDNIAEAVKQESSLYAERKIAKEGRKPIRTPCV